MRSLKEFYGLNEADPKKEKETDTEHEDDFSRLMSKPHKSSGSPPSNAGKKSGEGEKKGKGEVDKSRRSFLKGVFAGGAGVAAAGAASKIGGKTGGKSSVHADGSFKSKADALCKRHYGKDWKQKVDDFQEQGGAADQMIDDIYRMGGEPEDVSGEIGFQIDMAQEYKGIGEAMKHGYLRINAKKPYKNGTIVTNWPPSVSDEVIYNGKELEPRDPSLKMPKWMAQEIENHRED